MKKIILGVLTCLCLSFSAQAGDGHDHGNSAFENQQLNVKEFELSATQIHNLQLQTAFVQPFVFYDTITVPMVVDTMHDAAPLIHGFIYEGQDIMKIRKGQSVAFTLDIMPNKEFQGKIVRLEDMIDPQSRLYSVYAATEEVFPRNSQGLKGEMTIKITPEEKALGIPITAVQGEFGGYFVFVRHGQHFERREVFVGHKTGNMIEVDGVREGEEVVTLGSHQLRYAAVKPLAAHEHSVNEETRE